jgi:hypothetical protein
MLIVKLSSIRLFIVGLLKPGSMARIKVSTPHVKPSASATYTCTSSIACTAASGLRIAYASDQFFYPFPLHIFPVAFFLLETPLLEFSSPPPLKSRKTSSRRDSLTPHSLSKLCASLPIRHLAYSRAAYLQTTSRWLTWVARHASFSHLYFPQLRSHAWSWYFWAGTRSEITH